MVLLSIIVGFILCIPEILNRLKKESNATFTEKHQIVLLVTAHPDDECMFFSPTILGLLDSGAKVHLMCLSKGKCDILYT